ncbi:MAG: polyketide cyclase [Acidimicrobiales bacterium]
MASERIAVRRAVAADPSAVFELLRDPEGHVRIDASGMLMAASGDPVSGVGDRFVVHMDRESLQDFPLGEYDVTVVITTFEQDREIAWTIEAAIRPQIGHIYGYELEPIDGGTMVTSYYDWSAIHESYRAAGIFPVISETNLRATLGILARTVAPGAGRPDAGS